MATILFGSTTIKRANAQSLSEDDADHYVNEFYSAYQCGNISEVEANTALGMILTKSGLDSRTLTEMVGGAMHIKPNIVKMGDWPKVCSLYSRAKARDDFRALSDS